MVIKVMLNFKTKEYTFKDTDGKDVNIKYNYTEKTRKLLKMMTGADIENVENLKEAKLIKLLFKASVRYFVLRTIVWLSVAGFLTYNIFTSVETFEMLKYGTCLLAWLVFTWQE